MENQIRRVVGALKSHYGAIPDAPLRRDPAEWLRHLGVDRAVAFTLLGRGWSAIAGPISLIFVARYLSSTEQGYYYTFNSVLALTVFFELGLATVIGQFASHENALLGWSDTGLLEGDVRAKSRLSSLVRATVKWYGVIAALAFTLILVVGFRFFAAPGGQRTEVAWQAPWVVTTVVTAASMAVWPFWAVLEGCGLVAEVAKLRLWQGIAGTTLFWVTLWAGLALGAAPVVVGVSLVLSVGWILTIGRPILADLWRFRGDGSVIHWRQEIWPMQWRIALSWLSGYFINQLFAPILFAFHGAAVAGQVGMSLALVMSLTNGSLTWVYTKAPIFGVLIARREFGELDRRFVRALVQATFVWGLGAVLLWAIVLALSAAAHPFSHRLVSPGLFGVLLLGGLVSHLVGAEATYLRAHKAEPFLWLSVGFGAYQALCGYFLGRYYGAGAMVIGYVVGNVVIWLGIGTPLFLRLRRAWHGPESVRVLQASA